MELKRCSETSANEYNTLGNMWKIIRNQIIYTTAKAWNVFTLDIYDRFLFWRWSHLVWSKRLNLYTKLHGVISHKTLILCCWKYKELGDSFVDFHHGWNPLCSFLTFINVNRVCTVGLRRGVLSSWVVVMMMMMHAEIDRVQVKSIRIEEVTWLSGFRMKSSVDFAAREVLEAGTISDFHTRFSVLISAPSKTHSACSHYYIMQCRS